MFTTFGRRALRTDQQLEIFRMYIVQSTWIFLMLLYPSAICREIAVPCSMRRDYKECIGNESCSWCCDSAASGESKLECFEQGEVCRCEETSVREKRYVPPECAEAGYTGVDMCRPDNASTVDCYGRGTCVCGTCECEFRTNPNEVIFGTFCECDNFSCERWNGVPCGGPERGLCLCGVCECSEEWSGPACSCGRSNQTCSFLDSDTSELCSGRGTCDCGRCTCEQGYSGTLCETEVV